MHLYFIRHGQSENNALWDRTGSNHDRSTDPELTPTGILQVHHLAKYIAKTGPKTSSNKENNQNQYGFVITHLYSSLMVRAIATGSIISEVLKIPLLGWKDIHEIGGIYRTNDDSEERIGFPGKNRDYFEINYPSFLFPEETNETGWWNSLVENYEDAQIRAQRVFNTLINRHGDSDDRVAVVSHAGFYNLFLNIILNSNHPTDNEDRVLNTPPLTQFQHWFLLNNAAITRIDFIDNNIDFVYMNRTQFLPKHLITI